MAVNEEISEDTQYLFDINKVVFPEKARRICYFVELISCYIDKSHLIIIVSQ